MKMSAASSTRRPAQPATPELRHPKGHQRTGSKQERMPTAPRPAFWREQLVKGDQRLQTTSQQR